MIVRSNLLVKAIELPFLGEVTISVTIEFNNLIFPSAVVETSSTNFESASPPSRNVIEDSPFFASKVRLFKSSIHNNVLVSIVTDQFNIVNSQSIAVRTSSSNKLEFVDSLVHFDLDFEVVDLVVSWFDVSNFLSIPNNNSLAGIERNSVSAGILECQGESSFKRLRLRRRWGWRGRSTDKRWMPIIT